MYLYIAKETTHMCVWVWFGGFWSKCYCNWCNKSEGGLNFLLFIQYLIYTWIGFVHQQFSNNVTDIHYVSAGGAIFVWLGKHLAHTLSKNTIQFQLNESFYGIQTTFCLSMSTRFPSKMLYDLCVWNDKWNKCECDFKF